MGELSKVYLTKLPDPIISESLYHNKFALYPMLTFLNTKQALFRMYLLKSLVHNIYAQATNHIFKLKPKTIVLQFQNKHNLGFCESFESLWKLCFSIYFPLKRIGKISVF